jgi:hypothetical protein
LFGGPAIRTAAGNIVSFVLWFETRTVGAMTLRSAVWIVLAIGACRILGCVPRGIGGKT